LWTERKGSAGPGVGSDDIMAKGGGRKQCRLALVLGEGEPVVGVGGEVIHSCSNYRCGKKAKNGKLSRLDGRG